MRALEMGRFPAGKGPQDVLRREGVVDGLGVLVRIVQHQQDLVVQEVHVDDARHIGFLAAHRILDRGDLGRAGRHIEDADGGAAGALVHQALRDDAGSEFQRGPHVDDIVHQRREAHLDEARDRRAVRGDEGRDLGVVVHIHVVELDHAAHFVLHFIDMGEPQLHDAGIDRLRVVLLLELADEGGGHQAHPVPVVEQPAEVVLLDVDGLVRTHLHALSAVHALVVRDDRLPVPDADGPGRAGAHAGGAPLAQVVVDPERMSEIGFCGHGVRRDKRSW